ncbi:TRAP transporter substrate-binding protein [Pelagibacterium halotolerans]|uniref:TRAP-type C4-dicarboxylate transport system, periplasmic component n=1 Tax=Pelagibacterium halotolerans (strain DSM 22347 / JCM 15775 / CGMCC 1.7692 / B2) TaxID=1082931 RepID=G4REM7_PELHB|nr:TRAP transporter substrate-binding protein [Pelagibacterium halotolerans]AEQ50877.1 TRAP-type C4-dicarboxylate transport system, periplasmic component [Pelagibacterium halotolerans B2]QJR19215.1 TRAP transporter substrate-binding protein [Pelagibacterium halotolerans]SDZ98735.1 TRAP-type C4-dicarboxylate transport system, substrate-binding protein [Pelagibacterium halotolerans]
MKTLVGLSIGALVAGMGMAAPANAETWRLSSMMTPDSFEGLAYQRFADLVNEYTDGEITVRVYPNEQLGNMEAVVEQLSQNIIQLAPSGISFLSRWEDGIRYAAAPFLFDDYEHWSNFIRGELFQGWLDTVEEEADITILGDIPDFPRGSFRTLLSSEPIEDASSIEGMRVRQYQDQLVVSAWEHLGAEVRILPWGEVYDGISRGIVDAVTSPAESIESMRFYEVAPYIVRTDEYPQAVSWMMNAQAWDGLSEENQQAVTRAHEEAAAYARELIDEQSATMVETLTAEGDVTFDTEFDTSAWVESMRAFYAARAEAGELPEGLLDAVEAAR